MADFMGLGQVLHTGDRGRIGQTHTTTQSAEFLQKGFQQRYCCHVKKDSCTRDRNNWGKQGERKKGKEKEGQNGIHLFLTCKPLCVKESSKILPEICLYAGKLVASGEGFDQFFFCSCCNYASNIVLLMCEGGGLNLCILLSLLH